MPLQGRDTSQLSYLTPKFVLRHYANGHPAAPYVPRFSYQHASLEYEAYAYQLSDDHTFLGFPQLSLLVSLFPDTAKYQSCPLHPP